MIPVPVAVEKNTNFAVAEHRMEIPFYSNAVLWQCHAMAMPLYGKAIGG
jgi:hypothetical protein